MTLSKTNFITQIVVVSTLLAVGMTACHKQSNQKLKATVFQTSAAGDKLTEINLSSNPSESQVTITLNDRIEHQTIQGFGGAFTESSATVINQLSQAQRNKIMEAYFSDKGAKYSLTRTHMNSCDFSVDHYSYLPVDGDTTLQSFSIFEDTSDIIPMIKHAQKISTDGFKIIASPWTAPPWMKDNNHWYGGKLRPEYYSTWAKFFVRYAQSYDSLGIPIWAFTVENEPLGNDAHWESMHYTPSEMADFVKLHLGPQLAQNNIASHILVYDQNRGRELEEWASVLLKDSVLLQYIYGTAVHWYTGTVDYFPASLQFTHNLAPTKSIIHTEGCIDAEVPHWKDDQWYWKKEATDWGWDWAAPEDKKDHPKYVPSYRYARDIIGCLNNWVEGWVDWNMVLDKSGGPNLAQNWCIAPVIADPATDEVYFTPLYYVMSHFSKYVRPQAKRIEINLSNNALQATAFKNSDGNIVLIAFNESDEVVPFTIDMNNRQISLTIDKKAIQTILLTP